MGLTLRISGLSLFVAAWNFCGETSRKWQNNWKLWFILRSCWLSHYTCDSFWADLFFFSCFHLKLIFGTPVSSCLSFPIYLNFPFVALSFPPPPTKAKAKLLLGAFSLFPQNYFKKRPPHEEKLCDQTKKKTQSRKPDYPIVCLPHCKSSLLFLELSQFIQLVFDSLLTFLFEFLLFPKFQTREGKRKRFIFKPKGFGIRIEKKNWFHKKREVNGDRLGNRFPS